MLLSVRQVDHRKKIDTYLFVNQTEKGREATRQNSGVAAGDVRVCESVANQL